MSPSVGTYVLYTQVTPGQVAPGHIHYALIEQRNETINPHLLILCVNVNLPMLMVAWVTNRFCVLPNRRVDAAKHAIAAPPQGEFLEAVAFSLKTTAAIMGAVGAVEIVGAAAAPGLYGAAMLMNGLAVCGGGTVMGGIGVVSGGPAALASEALIMLATKDENDDDTKKATKIATRCSMYLTLSRVPHQLLIRYTASGAAAGAMTAAVPMVGGSLSAAGITSGLAGVGSVVGGGMAAGILVCAAAPLLAVGVVGSLVTVFTRMARQETLEQEYLRFVAHHAANGFGGPP